MLQSLTPCMVLLKPFCLCIPSQHVPPFHIQCKCVCTDTQRPVFHTSLDWTIGMGLYFAMWTLLHIVLWMISLFTLVPCCFTKDISHFKESELLKLVKWHIVNRSRPAMDCLVKVENPVLPSCIGRHKVSSNVLTVSYEFWLSVGVDEPHCMLEHAVHDKPIPVVPDCFGWFQMSKSEFKVPEHLSCLVVSDGWVDCRDDNIKVNHLSLQYYDPLGVWKLR